MSRYVYLLALTIESDRDGEDGLDNDAWHDHTVENVVGFSTAREALETGLDNATTPVRLVGLMVVGRIPTYEEVNP